MGFQQYMDRLFPRRGQREADLAGPDPTPEITGVDPRENQPELADVTDVEIDWEEIDRAQEQADARVEAHWAARELGREPAAFVGALPARPNQPSEITDRSAGLVALYEAAGIEPGLSTEEAAEHLAELIAENKRLTAAVERQTLLSKMSIDRGALKIDVIPPRETVINWVLAARAMLGDAENYSEVPVELPPSVEMGIGTAGEPYVVIVQRLGKISPHQARRRAEAERDQIRDAVLALADEQDQAAANLLDHATTDVCDQLVAIRDGESAVRSALATRLREIAER